MKAFARTFNLFNDTDYLSVAATLAGAGPVTLLVVAAGLFAPQKVTITSVGNDSGLTFTITGTDQWGAVQTEDLAGANADTAVSTKYYTSVTSIVSDGATAADIECGLNGIMEFVVVADVYAAGNNVAVSLVSGSGTFSVSHGYVNPFKSGFAWTDQKWITASGMTDKTASTDLYYTGGVWAFKLATTVAGAGASVLELTILKTRAGY